MNTKILLWICGMIFLSGACREEFDDHYNKIENASIQKNVTQVLEEKGGFKLFLQMIQRADLERTLSQSGLYTCLAPKDEHVQAWLDQNGWTVASMPERKLIEFINYHFILGMKYYYNYEKFYENTTYWDEYPLIYSSNLMFPTRAAGEIYPSKNIRIFTQSYLDVKKDDYTKMMNTVPGDFMVENVPISATDRDIPTSNGVIHVLDGPLMLTPRMDEVMEKDPELSTIMKWFDRFKGWRTVGLIDDKLDTTRIKYYNVSMFSASRQMDIANEAYTNIAFIPNNSAMETYFADWVKPEAFGSFDSIPKEFVVNFLQALVSPATATLWGISDIERNMPYFSSYSGDMLALQNNLGSMLVDKGCLISSNSMIYKLKEVPQIPFMTSVAAGYYYNFKRYKEWRKLLERKNISVIDLFGVSNSYQHSPRVMLMQPDDSKAWNNNGAEWGVDGYPDDYQDTLLMRLQTGILVTELPDNKFEHRYYPTPYGFILCEKENGQPVFSDYTGKKKINLSNPEPVYTADNGAIFEIDGIFQALLSTDSTQLLYRKYVAKDDNLARFKELVEKANQKDMLDKTSYTQYTVFAPSNAAFSGINISTMTESDAVKLLNKHVISGRRIFTDGYTKGIVTNLNGGTITLSGAWESFAMEIQYDRANIILDKSNRQGSNGVLHVIDHLLEK